MTILERILQHDAWTTGQLLKLSAGLSEAQLDQDFDIGHRTLRATFAHIIFNMECWCDLMNGVPQRAKSHNSIPELNRRLDLVAGQLLAIGKKVSEENLEDEYFVDYLDDPPRRKTFGAGLVHIATHGTHHRAQCLFIMRRLGMQNLIEGDAMSWEVNHRGKTWPRA